MRRPFSVILMVLLGTSLNAQDFQWWNDLHNWNGVTPWRNYIQMSTSGLGPNALPVPTFRSKGIDNGISINNQLRYHHYKEDPTFDHHIRVDYGMNERIGLSVWMVTVEHYDTSIELRNERKIREFEPRGFTSGDVYIATYLRLLEEKQKLPEITISANLKTASGNNFRGGRHTDTPGYYFDATFAKTFGKWRPYVSAGLYVYQTFSTRNFQNDGLLYGVGTHYLTDRYDIQVEWAGYNGYFEIGDQPSVLRCNFDLKPRSSNVVQLNLQLGINDLPYHTISLGYTYIY